MSARRRAYLLFMLALLIVAKLISEAEAQELSFEVASVQPTRHARDAGGWSCSSVDDKDPVRFVAQNESMNGLIRWAWDLDETRVIGPDWMKADDECFDIQARAAKPSTRAEQRLMLQSLLAERFRLVSHRETREMAAYDLTVVKRNGRALRSADGSGPGGTQSAGGELMARNVTMKRFAAQLARETGRPVFDQTELAGMFDFELSYAPEDNDSRGRPDLFAALRQQLGLSLTGVKRPVEVLVVDSALRRPTGN